MGNLNRPKFRRFWFPVILYSGIIFCVSSLPNVTAPLPEMHLDAVFHIFIYMPFGFLLASAIYNTKTSISKGTLLGLVLFLSFLYGGSDEVHQSFVPGRNAEMIDLIADTIGGTIGGCVYFLFLRYRKSN